MVALRDPREIRRLLNVMGGDFSGSGSGLLQGPPAVWVEQLLPMVVQDGVSTFILGSDDPTVLTTSPGSGSELA
jgi:hypothetical protein